MGVTFFQRQQQSKSIIKQDYKPTPLLMQIMN